MKKSYTFKFLLLAIALSCSCFNAIAQTSIGTAKTNVVTENTSKGDLAENLWYGFEPQWETSMIQTLASNKTDFQQFLEYNQKTFYKDKGDFFSSVSNGILISGDDARAFFDGIKAKYTSLYSLFQKIKSSNPGAIDAAIIALQSPPADHSRGACNSSCNNIGFENGTLSAWTAYYGVNSSSSTTTVLSSLTGGPCGSVTQAAGPDANTGSDYHVTIMSGGADPVAGAMIPLVPPLGGNCARIGDGPINGAGVGVLQQTYIVSSSNPILTVQYAVVLENPGHSASQQPFFKLEVLDQNGNPIAGCGQYMVISGAGISGFKGVWYPANSDTVYCKAWTTAFVPLYNYIGQCVTVKVTAADCALGGHFGYGYLACTCSKLDLVASSTVFCNGQKSATITGPPGAAQYQWSTTGGCISGSSTQQTLKVTCGGMYKLITTSSAGAGCVDTFSINIPTSPSGPPPKPCFSADEVCAGTPTHFNAACSTPNTGAKFYWDFYNNGQYQDSSGTSPTFVFSTGGTYKVRLHEIVGLCGADTIINVIVDPVDNSTFPTTAGLPTNASSCTACNGSIKITISGVKSGPTYHVSSTINTISVEPVVNGSPIVTGGTLNGYSSSSNNGVLSLNWTFTNICPGIYYIYTNSNSAAAATKCNPGGTGDTITVVVNANGVNISSNQVTSPATCNKNNGSCTITGLGGTAPYTFTWPGALGTGATKTGLSPGTYVVNIKDASGCMGSVTVKILAFAKLTGLAIPYDVTCFGANNGGIKITPLSGTPPFTYAWTPNVSVTDTAGSLSPGNYTIILTDAGGCTGSVTATVAQPTQLRDSIASSHNNLACGLKAYATVGVKGGSPPYAFKWSDGSIAPTDTMLVSGPYTVTVTDGNGCTVNASIPIVINCGPTITATGGVICSGSCKTITTTAVSGTTPYTYSWNNGATTSTIAPCPVTTTTYTVTVADANAKTATATATITVNSTPTVTIPPATICAGNSATLTASGATTYTWTPATGLSVTTGTSVVASPTVTTTYSVTGSNPTGCSNTATVIVTVNPKPVVTAPGAIICKGNATNLTASGATTYTWTPATGLSATTGATVVATPTVTTTYTVVGSNPTGCSSSVTCLVTVNPPCGPSVTATGVTVCNGICGTITSTAVSGIPPYSYLWNTGETTAAITPCPGATTTYTITVTDNSVPVGTATATAVVTVNPNPVVAVPPATICFGSSAPLTATGAGTYTWVPAATVNPSTGASVIATPTVTTTYTVTGTNPTGCTGTTTVTVTVNPIPVVTVPNASICPGGAIGLTASGATTYTWSPSTGLSATTGANVNANPGITTVYTICGTSLGCSSCTTATVTVGAIVANAGPDVSLCFGGSTILTASGGTTYVWDDGTTTTSATSITVAPTTTTTYTVTATTLSCTATDAVTVKVDPAISLNVAPVDVTCFGACNGQTIVIPSGGTSPYTYSWSSGCTAAACNNVCAGIYTLTTTDAAGCTASGTTTVSQPTQLTVTAPVSTNVSCFGVCDGTASLTANGGTPPYNYSWNSAPTQALANATGLCAGTFTCTVTDANGCTVKTSVTITQPTAVIVTSANAAICPNQSVTLNAAGTGGSGIITFSWSPAGTLSSGSGASVVASPGSTTVYTITGTDANGCIGGTSITVTVNPSPVINVPPATICENTSTTLTASGANIYSWSPATGLSAVTGSTVTASPIITTPYTVIGTSTFGCTASTTVIVTVDPAPILTATGGSGCPGDTSTLTVSGAITYSWKPGNSLSSNTGSIVVAHPGSTTTYTITGVGPNGCTATATSTVAVNPKPHAIFSATPQPTDTFDPTIYFYDQSTNGPITFWTWSLGDLKNTGSSSQNPHFTYPDTAACYQVQLIVINQFGCIDTTSNPVCIKGIYTFYIPNTFTPNNDGINDGFMPKGTGIDESDYDLWIFDRWGNLIWHTNIWGDAWDGKANHGAEIAQIDTYVWKVHVKEKETGNKHNYIGHVNIIK